MKQCIDVYTGLYTDNTNGTAYTYMVVGKAAKEPVRGLIADDTYMNTWMNTTSKVVARLPEDYINYEETTLFIHCWTPNIVRMGRKMVSVYNQLKDYDESMWDVLDIKLRKPNKARYEYHDAMKSMILCLLERNSRTPLTLEIKATPPKKAPEMGLLYQKAIKLLEDSAS